MHSFGLIASIWLAYLVGMYRYKTHTAIFRAFLRSCASIMVAHGETTSRVIASQAPFNSLTEVTRGSMVPKQAKTTTSIWFNDLWFNLTLMSNHASRRFTPSCKVSDSLQNGLALRHA